ncbi:MAG: delta-60 repeat domain-containing protein, partial [Nitrospiria bacterium]
GRIVAGGFASNGINNDFALARYDTNGALDGTFGTGGRVTTSFGTGVDEINALVVQQTDDKIVAGGFSFISGNNDFTLARFDSNGALDATFGAGGKVITAAGAGDDHIHAVALQTDGKIVAGGFSFSGTSVDFALARYNTDGSLDTNTDADPGTHFDTDGTLTTAVGGGADEINAIAVQTDNKIITAGFTFGVNNIRNKDFALSRLNADGTLDTTFGTSGKVTTAIGNADSLGHDVIHALALQTDGKIVAGGHTHNAATGDNFMLARYDTGGVLDPGFGTGGLVQTPINANDEEVNAILLQTDGKIIAAGTSFTNEVAPASSHHDFTVARYNANGTLDAVFGTGGIVKTPIGLGSFADTVRLQTDGKIVVAGSSENAAGFDFAVVRYNTNGTLDTTFDADGIVTTEISTGHDFAKAVQIQGDGKIVVAGTTFPGGGPEQFALARYNSDGSLDTSFGVNGVATTSFANGGQAFALQIQSDGKILAGGFSNSAQNSRDFTLARFLADGTLDTGFGVGGIEISPFSGGMDEIHDLIVLSNGNLLAAGFSTNGHGENTDFHLARYAP